MSYHDFKRRWDALREEALAAVRREDPPEALPVAAQPAFLENAAKLRGVKRIDGHPYATHPTRMALALAAILPADDPSRAASIVFALLHDYLEEGDGVDAAGVAAMRAALPHDERATLAAVVLTEPVLPPGTLPRFQAETSYVAQLETALPRLEDARAFANASLADKLDNMHDLGYILRRKSPWEKRAAKLAVKMAYYRLVLDTVRPWASPEMVGVVDDATESMTSELRLAPALVEDTASAMRSTLESARPVLAAPIRRHLALAGL